MTGVQTCALPISAKMFFNLLNGGKVTDVDTIEQNFRFEELMETPKVFHQGDMTTTYIFDMMHLRLWVRFSMESVMTMLGFGPVLATVPSGTPATGSASRCVHRGSTAPGRNVRRRKFAARRPSAKPVPLPRFRPSSSLAMLCPHHPS